MKKQVDASSYTISWDTTSRITRENNEKIRPLPDGENAFAMCKWRRRRERDPLAAYSYF